jgi:hypothetical protein
MSKITTFAAPTMHSKYALEGRDYDSCLVRQEVTTTYEGAVGPFVKSAKKEFKGARHAFVPIPREWDDAEIASNLANGQIVRILGLSMDSVLDNSHDDEETKSLRRWVDTLRTKASSGNSEAQERLDKFEDNLIVKDADGLPVMHQEYGVTLFRRLVFMIGVYEDIDHCDKDFAATLTSDDDVVAVTTAAPAEVVNA